MSRPASEAGCFICRKFVRQLQATEQRVQELESLKSARWLARARRIAAFYGQHLYRDPTILTTYLFLLADPNADPPEGPEVHYDAEKLTRALDLLDQALHPFDQKERCA